MSERVSDGVKPSYTQPANTSQMNCSGTSAQTSVFEIHKFCSFWVRVDRGVPIRDGLFSNSGGTRSGEENNLILVVPCERLERKH